MLIIKCKKCKEIVRKDDDGFEDKKLVLVLCKKCRGIKEEPEPDAPELDEDDDDINLDDEIEDDNGTEDISGDEDK